MTAITAWIYFGGCCARPDEKLGIFTRMCWPFDLGERLAEFAWRKKDEAGN